MILAAIGDIGGHADALAAVLADIDAAGIQTIVNTGDSVAGGPRPNETIALLRTRDIPSVQGDMDRRVARLVRKQRTLRAECTPEVFEALQRTYEALRSDHVEFLAGLPRERRLSIDGLAIYVCHGSPHGQEEGLGEGDPLILFQRFREVAEAAIVVTGHTRTPFSRMLDGTLFVNPGAVGDVPACYAVVDTEAEPWSVTFRRVDV